jgi:hypothetical protein
MSQPTFSDGPPVPIMVEGVMQEAMLRQYFTDLQTCATIMEILEKNLLATTSVSTANDLNTLLHKLLNGETRRAQIRYLYDGVHWTDTLLASRRGFKVVRCRHDDS